MVIDTITRAAIYSGLGPRFKRALTYVTTVDVGALAAGTYEIDGRQVYAMVQEYQSKRQADGRWEAHRQYIDLQFIVAGTERIGFAPVGRMAAGSYDKERDFEVPSGDGEFLTLRAGDFMLIWPGEAHMPGMAVNDPAPVKKVVVKIAAG